MQPASLWQIMSVDQSQKRLDNRDLHGKITVVFPWVLVGRTTEMGRIFVG